MRLPHLAVVEVNVEPGEEVGLNETFPASLLTTGVVNSRTLGSVCRRRWNHHSGVFLFIWLIFFLCSTEILIKVVL